MSELKVDENLVNHVLGLARLEATGNEVSMYKEHMQKVIEHFKEMEAVNTDGVSPLKNPLIEFEEFYTKNPPRHEDEIKESLEVKKLLQNSPDSKLNQFRVEAYWDEE